jgi:hypothetical protein
MMMVVCRRLEADIVDRLRHKLFESPYRVEHQSRPVPRLI